MRKFIMIAFIGSMTTGAFVAASLGQETKIGFVNTVEVLTTTEDGKREVEELNQLAAQRQQEIATQSSELQKLQDQYLSQQATLNSVARAQSERTIADKERDLQRLREDIELELNQRQNEMLARASEKIQVIINEYAKLNGFGAIFLRNEGQTYVDLLLDITQDVISIYNERYPAVAQAAAQ